MTERLTDDLVQTAQPELVQTSVSLAAYARLLRRNRNLRRLWSAQIVSEIGDWFYSLAIYTLLLQLTGRASFVALALMLQVLPMTLMGPTAGIVNDRISRKKVMITSDLVRMVVVLAMILVRSRSTVWLVYPLLLLETIMVAFFEPARNAVIPNITSRERSSSPTHFFHHLVDEPGAGRGARGRGRRTAGTRRRLHPQRPVLSRFRAADPRHALRRAAHRFRRSTPRPRSGRLLHDGGGHALRAPPAAPARHGLRQSRTVRDRPRLGLVHRDGTALLSRTLARH